jgi:hypothetical protein
MWAIRRPPSGRHYGGHQGEPFGFFYARRLKKPTMEQRQAQSVHCDWPYWNFSDGLVRMVALR